MGLERKKVEGKFQLTRGEWQRGVGVEAVDGGYGHGGSVPIGGS